MKISELDGISYGPSNNLIVFVGNPASGPGGNAFDGGILFHQPTGDYQVGAYQVSVTDGALPEWGPVSEFVVKATHDQATNFARISFTAMGAWAGPALNDAADDFRVQQEAAGTVGLKHIKFTSQINDTGWLVEYMDLLPSGSVQMFRRTDGPAPLADALEFALDTDRRANSPVLTAAGTRNSPSLRLTGKAFDTTLHRADWKMQVNVDSNSGASRLRVSSKKDAAAYATLLDLIENGTLAVYGSLSLGSANPGAGSTRVITATNDGAFGTVPADTASLRVADKSPGSAAWKMRGENGFESWVMGMNDLQARGSDTTGSNVFSRTANPLGPNAGFIVSESPTGAIIYVPYWTNIST